jgi:hypothetical protein
MRIASYFTGSGDTPCLDAVLADGTSRELALRSWWIEPGAEDVCGGHFSENHFDFLMQK